MRFRALPLLALALACSGPRAALAQEPETPPAAQDSLYDLALPRDAAERARLSAAIEAALAAPDRPEAHRFRDDQREVRSIMAAADVHPGDRVLDIGSGGAYLAVIMSAMAGDKGRIDIHNTPGWIADHPEFDPDALKIWLHRDNVRYVTAEWDKIPIRRNAYDVIVIGEAYHEAVADGSDVAGMNRRFYRMLKPGGRIVIEDHAADPAMDLMEQVRLHRIAVNAVMEQMQAAGFQLAGSLAIISAHDDPRFTVFTPGIRGRTERFILSFEKPAH